MTRRVFRSLLVAMVTVFQISSAAAANSISIEGHFSSDGDSFAVKDFSIINAGDKPFPFSFIVSICNYEFTPGPLTPNGQISYFSEKGFVYRYAHGNTDPRTMSIVDKNTPSVRVHERTISPSNSGTLGRFKLNCQLIGSPDHSTSVRFEFQDHRRETLLSSGFVRLPDPRKPEDSSRALEKGVKLEFSMEKL